MSGIYKELCATKQIRIRVYTFLYNGCVTPSQHPDTVLRRKQKTESPLLHVAKNKHIKTNVNAANEFGSSSVAVSASRINSGNGGSDLIDQVAASIVGGTNGSSLARKGVCKERLFQIISVTTLVAISRRVQRY